MALDTNSAALDVTGAYIHSQFAKQSWYKENANFITTLGGLLATVVAWAASQPFADAAWIQVLILVAGFVLTTLGVKVTPNGISKSQIRKVSNAQAAHVDSTPLVVNQGDGDVVEDNGVDLEAMTAEYNKSRP